MNNFSDPNTKAMLEQKLQDLVIHADYVDAVLAVTDDGRLIASSQRKEYTLKRLATMGSTLMSLGDTITKELTMGPCRNIISENEHGIVVFMHIAKNLVMVSMTSTPSALGLLLSASRNCIAGIVQDIKTA